MSTQAHVSPAIGSTQRSADGVQLEVGRPPEAERARLFAWLDDGLRAGRRGRLQGEYGALLDEAATFHVIARIAGRPASHVLGRVVDLDSADATCRVGLIGLVYTAPELRGRGLAARCIERAVEQLEARGAALVALWSELHDFYAKLGFAPAGLERLFQLDAAICRLAAREFPAPPPVRSPEPEDWAACERLYAAKPAHVVRAPGLLASLAAGPDCSLRVSGRVGRPTAYAVRGKGDDFPGIVHEWAGEPGAVLACLSALLPEGAPLGLLCGTAREAPVDALARAGAPEHQGCLALVRPLARKRLFEASVRSLFLWGFDSI